MEYGRFINFIIRERISRYKYLDLLEFYFPYKVYLYGNQYKVNRENKISVLKESLKDYLREFYCIKQILFRKETNQKTEKNILSGAYFGVNSYLNKLGYNTVYGPWLINGTDKFIGSYRFIHDYYTFKRKILKLSFQESISEKCSDLVVDMVNKTRKVMRDNNIKAFIASSTHAMENRIPLQAAKEEGIPTFVFLHGLPFPFYYEEPERADYLIVWSEQIKKNFVKYTNFPESNIYVSGHPLYQKFSHLSLRNNLNNILIISPSAEAERHQDRGNMISYLYELEKILKEFGVEKVRYRPHPHENAEWYLNYINRDFFSPDRRPLSKALEDSTLVIGTLSTIVVEALYYGVNYLLYDPIDERGKNIYGHTTVPPFDGSEQFLPVAKNEKEMYALLNEKKCADIRLFNKYIKTPFDITFIKDLI